MKDQNLSPHTNQPDHFIKESINFCNTVILSFINSHVILSNHQNNHDK